MFVIGVPLATLGVISLTPAWLTLPLVGMAVAVVTVTVDKLTGRISATTCLTCGRDLASEPVDEHGVVCPSCGALNQHGALFFTNGQGDEPAEDRA